MTCKIQVEPDRVIIESLTIEDEEIASYLIDLEGEELCNIFERALKIGVLSLKTSQTAEEVHFIEKAFDKLHTKFEKELEGYLGEDGTLAELFNEDNKLSAISKISEIVEKQLDPNEEGTALYSVKRSMIREFQDLKEKLGIAEAVEEEREKGTAKGRDFEEIVYTELDRLAIVFEDEVIRTGDTIGKLLKSKKGDIVVRINPEHSIGVETNIVFEVKDKRVPLSGKNSIFLELEEAMENRDARVSVAVFTSSYVPEEVGVFRRYPPNKMICSLDKEEVDTLALELAYKSARTNALSQLRTEKITVDAFAIRELTKKAEDKLARIKSIKSALTSVGKGIKDVQTEIDTLRDEIKEILDEINDNLKVKENK